MVTISLWAFIEMMSRCQRKFVNLCWEFYRSLRTKLKIVFWLKMQVKCCFQYYKRNTCSWSNLKMIFFKSLTRMISSFVQVELCIAGSKLSIWSSIITRTMIMTSSLNIWTKCHWYHQFSAVTVWKLRRK